MGCRGCCRLTAPWSSHATTLVWPPTAERPRVRNTYLRSRVKAIKLARKAITDEPAAADRHAHARKEKVRQRTRARRARRRPSARGRGEVDLKASAELLMESTGSSRWRSAVPGKAIQNGRQYGGDTFGDSSPRGIGP